MQKQKKGKLVIIIDELDRCRPTFAIQTLELAKHLFAIPGLVFIFALDIEQLSCSAKTVYGSGMDAAGYLCRFFDYIGKMPKPNQKSFIVLCLNQHRAFTSETTSWNRMIPVFIDELSKSFNLSLRDITTIVKTYLLIYDTFLTECTYPQLHHLYIFLISLKYKNVFLYSNFLLGKKHGNEVESAYKLVQKYLPTFNFAVKGVLMNQLQKLSVGIPLQQCDFEVLPSSVEIERRDPLTRQIRIETVRKDTLRGEEVLIITPRVNEENYTNWFIGNAFSFNFDNIFGDVLDYYDLIKWNMIRELTLGEYYYQQLEMFNFALPADEPESKS